MAVGAHSRTATLPSGGGRRLDQSDTDSSDVDAGRATRLQHSLGDDPKNGPKDGAIDDPTDAPTDGPKDGPKDGPMDGRDDASTQEVPGDELDRALHFPRRLAGAVGKAGPSRRLNSVGGGRITLVLAATSDSSLVAAKASSHPVVVTSATGQVLTRAATHDVFVEVPANTPTCGYNTACASTPLTLVDMVATNPHPTESQAVRLSFSNASNTNPHPNPSPSPRNSHPRPYPHPRPSPRPSPALALALAQVRLSFSRNFETRDASLAQSGTGAEITGLTAQIWETASLQPTGFPVQISKNWHEGSSDAYWAGYDGYWSKP